MGTPDAIVNKLHADMTAVLRTPEVQRRFTDLVIEVAPSSRADFAKFIASETERWKRVVKESGLPLQ
jgi:tripartite-type tricarboxylate transporter receptor subunit TctC